jgi:proteasome lid subunit RPN8/RPN11
VNAIQLSEAVRAEILTHARAEAPRECCGLLVGHGGLVDECYEIDARLHVATNRRLRGSGRGVVGAYHSHPYSPAWPSPSDVAEAYYSEFFWMIASLAGSEPELRAFRVEDGRIIELAIDPA